MKTQYFFRLPLCSTAPRALLLAALATSLLMAACMSPTEPDTPRKRITEPSRYFLRTFDLSSVNAVETGYDVKEVSAGGFIIVGSAWMDHNVSQDIFLLRTDNEGRQLWVKTYGGTNDDFGYSVDETSDGGFILTGSSRSFTNGQSDVWLVKTDESGTMQWSENFGDTEQDEGFEVKECSAGGYIIVGYSDNPTSGGRNLFLHRTDEVGNLIWHAQPTGSSQDFGAGVVETADGGFVAAGKTHSIDDGQAEIWLYKVNRVGKPEWDRHIGGNKAMEAVDIVQAADGSFAVVGSSSPRDSNSKEMLFVKTDASGDLVVEQSLHIDALARNIQLREDGGYVVCGYSDPYGGSASDIILVRLDASGTSIEKSTVSGMHKDRAHAVTPTSDGGFILTGTTESYGSGTPDVILVKTDAEGSYQE